MSPKNSFLTVGLTALGLFGYSASRVAYSSDPVAPSGPSAAPMPVERPSVLLLSNGRLLQGTVKKTADKYILIQNGGEIPFPINQVEDVFPSLAAVYQYKQAQIPANDPDEHLKLARWCLAHNLPAEAKVEVQAVVKFSPNSREARMMLTSMDAAEARLAARPQVDPGLVQTGAEMRETSPSDRTNDARPAEIDSTVLQRARRELGVSGLPIIFNLPPALAVRRADQFARVVHPVLQVSCAKCHNEHYSGRFQLVEVKTKADRTADVYRANLDATLQLIDPENPSRSELLSTTLMPHGKGPNRKPIFRGSNDRGFQILAAWAYSLRSGPAPTDNVTQTRYNPSRDTPSGFASERGAVAGSPVPPSTIKPLGDQSELPRETITKAPVRFTPGKGFVPEQGPPSEQEFPGPYTLPQPKPAPAPAPPAAKPGTQAIPPPATPADPTAAIPDPKNASATPKKPVKIDHQLLQQLLQNRNGAR